VAAAAAAGTRQGRGRLLLLQALVEQPLARCKSNYWNAKIAEKL
jgi:hypothetical protein